LWFSAGGFLTPFFGPVLDITGVAIVIFAIGYLLQKEPEP
jgi:hypothetical protein